jgi:hypothetical protein
VPVFRPNLRGVTQGRVEDPSFSVDLTWRKARLSDRCQEFGLLLFTFAKDLSREGAIPDSFGSYCSYLSFSHSNFDYYALLGGSDFRFKCYLFAYRLDEI